jgi:glycerol kinase
MRETTALGAAIAAGLAFGLWHNFTELRDINRAGGAVFEPSIPSEKSSEMFSLWEKAVQMSKGWVKKDSDKVNGVKPPGKSPVVVNVNPVESAFGIDSIFSDLEEADEEDLLLELRKLEIRQRLKRLRKLSNA